MSSPASPTRAASSGDRGRLRRRTLLGATALAPAAWFAGTGLPAHADEPRGSEAAGPVDDSAFAPPEGAAPPQHQFSGGLTLDREDTTGGWNVLRDPDDLTSSPSFAAALKSLPTMDLTFVQTGGHLVPVTQGLQYTGHSVWNAVVGPGRVWHEVGDGGADRVSFPFTLCYRSANDTFSGVMMFLFDGTTVSDVQFQVTQEICTWLSFDRWGTRGATYTPKSVPDAEAIKQAHLNEVEARIPVRPLADLAADHPDAGIDTGNFGRGVTPGAISALGVYYDGVNYVTETRTRYGVYAYPEAMRLGSFSLAKTCLTHIARLRLSQKYGEDVGKLLIKDLVPEAATSRGDWSAVTIDHALDMATGNYSSPGYEVDESSAAMTEFILAEPARSKTSLAFDWPHSTAPGTYWNYRTSDTYIATLALARYLKNKEGDTADLHAFLDREVYRPAGLSAGFRSQCMRTDNSPTGQPIGGYGLYFTRDDAAKISEFLNVHLGAVGEEQLLERRSLAASLQRDPADRGLPCKSSELAYLHYNQCTWAVHINAADPAFTQYNYPAGTDFWVPSMSGYSGNEIVMLPNGATYYYFSDNMEYAYNWPVRELHKLPPAEGTG